MKPWLSPRDTWGHFFNQSHLTPEAVGLRLCPSSLHCDTSGPTQSRGPNTITLQALVINAVIMFMRTRCDPMLQGVCVKPALTRFSILAPLHHCGRPNAGVPSSFLETQGNECLWWGPACLHGCFLNPLVVTGLWPIGTGRKWLHPLPGLAFTNCMWLPASSLPSVPASTSEATEMDEAAVWPTADLPQQEVNYYCI